MDNIKSAREIAMEKIEKLGEATVEERLRWKYVPEGEKLAARYLEQDCNLMAELNKYGKKVRQYVVEGIEQILARIIGLPDSDLAKRNNERAMDGLKALKQDKVAVENVYSQLRGLFNHYAEQGEQQKKQAYESLKAEFTAKVQQALQQQFGTSTEMRVDVEKQPQFQEEWRRIQTQIDSQYITLLGEYKQGLLGIS